MRKQVENEYWICIIGATNSANLKSGADAPMRNAVVNAFKKTTGKEHAICYSGWGAEKEKVDVINSIWSMDNDDELYKEIKNILIKNGRVDMVK